ncbi:hypothetical protein J132_00257 [Termitomyces sp. J132]|nr:hypothetical protein J132_00257 [Termitomyces sp. J132]
MGAHVPLESSQEFHAYTTQVRAVGRKPHPTQGGKRITLEWLESLEAWECLWHFRLMAEELVDMVHALKIPDVFCTTSQYSFMAVEALCLLCAQFCSAGDLYILSVLYDRSQSSITECINELVFYIDETWSYLLDCDQHHLLHPTQLAHHAATIHARGSPLPSIFGFIDCTIHCICQPTCYQCQAHNGHKKFHALKFQAIMLPNGIIGHLFGPYEGYQNDVYLLSESHLLERFSQFAFHEGAPPNTPLEECTLQIFGDPAYGIGPHIISPFSGAGERTKEEKEWNAQMLAIQIEVEHGFGIVANLWPFLNAGWKVHLYNSLVGQYYRVGVILTNSINCLCSNQVSKYFNCLPPSLAEYFHN